MMGNCEGWIGLCVREQLSRLAGDNRFKMITTRCHDVVATFNNATRAIEANQITHEAALHQGKLSIEVLEVYLRELENQALRV